MSKCIFGVHPGVRWAVVASEFVKNNVTLSSSSNMATNARTSASAAAGPRAAGSGAGAAAAATTAAGIVGCLKTSLWQPVGAMIALDFEANSSGGGGGGGGGGGHGRRPR